MKLDDLPIPDPCRVSRDEMRVTGLGRRFCERCEKTVYNLSAMSERQARELLRERAGKLCVEYWVDEQDEIQFSAARRKTPLRTAAALALPLVASACSKSEPAARDTAAEHANAEQVTAQPSSSSSRNVEPPASASADTTAAAAQSAHCKSQPAVGPKLKRLAGTPVVAHPPPSGKKAPPPPGCNPPFTIDAHGVRHVKPQCL